MGGDGLLFSPGIQQANTVPNIQLFLSSHPYIFTIYSKIKVPEQPPFSAFWRLSIVDEIVHGWVVERENHICECILGTHHLYFEFLTHTYFEDLQRTISKKYCAFFYNINQTKFLINNLYIVCQNESLWNWLVTSLMSMEILNRTLWAKISRHMYSDTSKLLNKARYSKCYLILRKEWPIFKK
jgi:hypothetical protein